MNEYSPLMFYLFTLVVCLGILLKTFKGVCKDEDMESSNLDFHGAQRSLERPQPGIFTIRLDPPIIDQNCDDKPPSYESLTQPPKYETVKEDFFEYPSGNCE
ncbi:unnamed protein product [Chironomus riparius]|uniref:Uncharacterized protein n=1 Tax=Chironomus riparius TaxID=315576 RepID=A0A9N9WUP4_9DIPT|nr:unnamed protein product [Chironomus riparius]